VSLKARVYIAFVTLVGAATLVRGFYFWNPQDLLRLSCYLALAGWASCRKVRLPGITGTMSVLFVFLLAGIVELGLPETLLIGAICVLLQSYWRARVRPHIVQPMFSVANIAVAIWATHAAYHALLLPAFLLQTPFRLLIAASVLFMANTFPVALVIALTERKSLRQVWGHCYWWSFSYYLTGAALVSMFTFANRVLNWQAWLLILPVIYVIYRSYYMYLDKLQAESSRAEKEHKHAEEVASLHARAMESLASAISAKTKLDAVIQASPLAILALDLDGNVTTCSPMVERMFGCSPEEAVGGPLPFAGERSGENIKDLIDRTRHGDCVSGMEMNQWRRDGSPFEAAIWTAPLRDGEGICGILVTVADVSDRKCLEEQLRHAQKMEAVGRLAGGVAHDFNNLLTVINGYSAMLADSLKDNRDEASQAEEILGAGTRAAELVSQLLAFSRRQMIKPTPLEINQLIQNVERMLRHVIGEHIQFRTVLDPDAGWIQADLNQIEAVLLNLSTNAQDAMAQGGVLSIETARLDVNGDGQSPQRDLPAGSYVCLMVKDNGHGMDAQTRQQMFEPFFTTKEKGKGTGLGLSSVYGNVEQNHGRIYVISEVGKGTTFSIYLPRIENPNSHESRPTRSACANHGTETILLVEDENSVRRMLREALSKAGYRVLEAENGSDAIRKWGAEVEYIDLLVTDIVMPVMNGLRLAEELRNRRPSLRVIFMSGHAEEVISKQSGPDPALDLLAKPFLPEMLVRRVREVLGQSSNTVLASRAVVLQSCEHGLGRRPDILQECENHGHLCSNGDTSNLR
jgi:PAS domain S-box-containing protein